MDFQTKGANCNGILNAKFFHYLIQIELLINFQKNDLQLNNIFFILLILCG